MNLAQLAAVIFQRVESPGVPHMAVGAIAAGTCGIPRATKDIDLLVSIDLYNGLGRRITGLEDVVEFDMQRQFETITWALRHVGVSRGAPPFKVELFEMFNDPFVESEFSRRRKKHVPLLNRHEEGLPSPRPAITCAASWPASVRFPSPKTATTP